MWCPLAIGWWCVDVRRGASVRCVSTRPYQALVTHLTASTGPFASRRGGRRDEPSRSLWHDPCCRVASTGFWRRRLASVCHSTCGCCLWCAAIHVPSSLSTPSENWSPRVSDFGSGAAGSTFGSPSSLGAAPAFGATSLLGGATAFGSPLPTQFSLEERARLIEWASLNGRRGSRRCACLRRPVAAWGRRRVWRKRPNSLCVNTKWWLRQLRQPSTGIQCTCADSRFRCCSFRQSALLTSAPYALLKVWRDAVQITEDDDGGMGAARTRCAVAIELQWPSCHHQSPCWPRFGWVGVWCLSFR